MSEKQAQKLAAMLTEKQKRDLIQLVRAMDVRLLAKGAKV